jgi:glycosyltransferase involved in cell wall biosynthesis
VKYELHVLGEGSDKKRCMQQARRLGVDEHIQWRGWLSHEDAKKQFRWAHVFVFTSLRDTTGTVLSESICHGVPVICFDHQGARDIVTNDCGIKIPLGSPGESVKRLADAIASLARDRTSLRSKSEAALERGKQYLWDELGERMAKVYADVWELQQPIDMGVEKMQTPARTMLKHESADSCEDSHTAAQVAVSDRK